MKYPISKLPPLRRVVAPSLQQSDHHRMCPWARWIKPSRKVEECECDRLRNADRIEAGDAQ
jgi:hypothetical protein